MIKLANFDADSTYQANKEDIEKNRYFVVDNQEKKELITRLPRQFSYVMYNYVPSPVLIPLNEENKIPLIRCDLFKEIKIDGVIQDLSGKAREPYVFTSTTIEDKMNEYQDLMVNHLDEYWITYVGQSQGSVEYYDISSNYSIIRSGIIEVKWNENVNDLTFFYFGTSLNRTSNNMFDDFKFNDLTCMFKHSSIVNADVLQYMDISNNRSMLGLFMNCPFISNIEISDIDTSNVLSLEKCFCNCGDLRSCKLSNLNLDKATTMRGMFDDNYWLESVEFDNVSTKSLNDISIMFYGCDNLKRLVMKNMDLTTITNGEDLYNYDIYLDYADFSNTSLGLFRFPKSKRFNFTNTNTNQMRNLNGAFDECRELSELDLSSFDTSNVTDMSYMFNGCNSLTSLDLSNFDTSNVTYMIGMFNECDSLIHIKCKQAFKDWCIAKQDIISLPDSMREGGSETWEIVD